MPAQPTVSLRPAYLVIAISFLAIVFEGYDLIVYGAVVPALLSEPGWGLTPERVGAIGGAALFGMFVGAPAAGWLGDRFGRRKLFLGSLTFFSIMMILVAWSPNPACLATFRFLAGVGFGGVPPTAIALVVEFAPAKRRVLFNAIMLAGFGIGGMLAGGLAIHLLSRLGFRGLFSLGALPLVTLIPLGVWLLPESPSFRPNDSRQRTHTVSPWIGVLKGNAGRATLLFSIAALSVNLVIYALNVWLPQLMRGAGYEIGSALHFLLLLNVGAVVGALSGGWLADRLGGKRVAVGLFFIAAVSLGLLSVPAPTGITSVLVFIAGAAALGNQSVLLGYVAVNYLQESRASALGLIFGVGRLGATAGPLLGGYLIAHRIGLKGNVTVFAITAVFAGCCTFFVPRILDTPAQASSALNS